MLVERKNERLPPPPKGFPLLDALLDRLQSVLARHGRKLWWFHSLYALTLGTFVVLFAQKGFERARILAITIGAAWLLVLLFFRLFGSGAAQHSLEKGGAGVRLRFFAMTYVIKNLYQGMLFFVLPFYFKSATWGAPNFAFVVLLGVCALLSTLDIVMDRVVMRRRAFASLFHGLTLFSCLNIVVPALFSNTRTLYSLLIAAGFTVLAFWTLHAPLRAFRKPKYLLMIVASIASGVAAAYYGRVMVPPVPMHLSKGAVGPKQLPDGRLQLEVSELHVSAIREIHAVTDVVVPGGQGDRLRHVWRLDGAEISDVTAEVERASGLHGTIRLRSELSAGELPKNLAGHWTIDIETEDGQLVGRVTFIVID